MYRHSILYILIALFLSGTNTESLHAQNGRDPHGKMVTTDIQTTDSLLQIGENMFYATSEIGFSENKDDLKVMNKIQPGDLFIILKRDQNILSVEWDNKVGFITHDNYVPFNMNEELANSVTTSNLNVNLVESKDDDQTEHYILQGSDCIIQIFASRYTTKKFTKLNDLGTIRLITFPESGITKYQLDLGEMNVQNCNQVLNDVKNRGFEDAFIVEE